MDIWDGVFYFRVDVVVNEMLGSKGKVEYFLFFQMLIYSRYFIILI